VATAQELPGPLQVVTDEAQVLATGSHDCEQHWAFDAHAAPATVQMTPEPPPPPVPPCPAPPLPVLIAFTELLPQLGRTNSKVTKRPKIAAMEIEVGEGLIMGKSHQRTRTAHPISNRAVLSGQGIITNRMSLLLTRSFSLEASEALSDEELVRRALTGDRWGREMLYRRHAGSLLAMTVRLISNGGDAEEIVQDTFVAAFEQLASLRESGAVGAWLRQIALNLVRRRVRRARLLRFLGLDRSTDYATLEALADPGLATDQRAELALIDCLLREMRPALRLAWMLRRVDGLELGEVASLCSCSLATVKRRIAAADVIVDRHVAEPRRESQAESEIETEDAP
jgi:RNA polymerase sigma-70 factor (ECF subfamily)